MATDQQITRLYAAIGSLVTPDTHGGDILDMVRNIVGRWNFSHWDELTSEEIEKAIKELGGEKVCRTCGGDGFVWGGAGAGVACPVCGAK